MTTALTDMLAARVEELEMQIAILKGNLRLYGGHSRHCDRPLRPDCSCGWDDVKRDLK